MKIQPRFIKLAEILAESFTAGEISEALLDSQEYRYDNKVVMGPPAKYAAVACEAVSGDKLSLTLKVSDFENARKFEATGYTIATGKIEIDDLVEFGYDGPIKAAAINEYLVDLTIIRISPKLNLVDVIPVDFKYDGQFRLV